MTDVVPVRIHVGRHPLDAGVEIDGRDIGIAVTGFNLTAKVGDFPTLTLDLASYVVTDFDGPARVEFTPEAKAVLISQGWTPPETGT